MLSLNVHWIYGVIIAAILGAFGWYTLHERSLQAVKDKAADQRVADAQLIHNTEVQDRAVLLTSQAMAAYQAAHDHPVPGPTPVLVCSAPAPRAGAVPAVRGPAAGGNGATAVPAEATGPVQVNTGAVYQVGRDADAQVALLQALIRAYQQAGVVAKK